MNRNLIYKRFIQFAPWKAYFSLDLITKDRMKLSPYFDVMQTNYLTDIQIS